MQPQSVTIFERLFLAGVALGVIRFAMADFSGNVGFKIASFVISTGVFLLLWYFITRKASNIARWILVIIVILSLAELQLILAVPLGLSGMLGLAMIGLQLVAILFLFQRDASAWLAGPNDGAPLD